MEERYYTVSQAADILGVGEYRVRSMYNRGLLRGFKLPGMGHRRISASSIAALLKKDGLLENDCFARNREEAWKRRGFNPLEPITK